jgi:hypothetical protein
MIRNVSDAILLQCTAGLKDTGYEQYGVLYNFDDLPFDADILLIAHRIYNIVKYLLLLLIERPTYY